MAEQHATAKYLLQGNCHRTISLDYFKKELSKGCSLFGEGFQKLKLEGFPVDAIRGSPGIDLFDHTVQSGWQNAMKNTSHKLM